MKDSFASVATSLLWACQPIVQRTRALGEFHSVNGEIVIEPCAAGGVTIAAACRTAMIVLRDPAGHCSGPMTLSVPDEAFAACAPRQPVAMTYCGDQYEVPLPEWAQPGHACLSSAGMFVMPKMRHSQWAEVEDDEFYPVLFNVIGSGSQHHAGRDYRWHAGAAFAWRRVLKYHVKQGVAAGGLQAIDPSVFALFDRVYGLFHNSERPFLLAPAAPECGLTVTIDGFPDFIGTLMPQRVPPGRLLPDWFEQEIHPESGRA